MEGRQLEQGEGAIGLPALHVYECRPDHCGLLQRFGRKLGYLHHSESRLLIGSGRADAVGGHSISD
jgi:hypothetical protein